MEQTFATPRPVFVFVHNDVGLTVITGRDGDTSHVSLTAETAGGWNWRSAPPSRFARTGDVTSSW